MNQPIPRPFSIWLVLAFLGLVAATIPLKTLRSLPRTTSVMDTVPSLSWDTIGLNIVWFLVVILTFQGLRSRKSWSRWLAVLCLLASIINFSVDPHGRMLFAVLTSGPEAYKPLGPPYFDYQSITQLRTAAIAQAIFFTALIALTFHLVLSRRLSSYFDGTHDCSA